MLAFLLSLAICRPFIIRFLKIIIHIAITSRIIDNKLDNGNCPRTATNSLFCTILTEFIAKNCSVPPRMAALNTLCNQITASWSSTIEWKNVIYLGNGQNKPWESGETEDLVSFVLRVRREGKTNDLAVVR